jgi:DNA ligase-1
VNADVLERVEAVGSRLEKERLLRELDEQGRRLVKLALDPDVTFGVTVDEDDHRARYMSATRTAAWPTASEEDGFWNGLESVLAQLRTRELTGSAASSRIDALLRSAPDTASLKWACRIVNAKLRAGFDIKTFNRVFGASSVKKFEVQLAATYDPEKHELKGLWLFQPKLDGNRVIGIGGEARSRNGKLYPSGQRVLDEIRARSPKFFDDWVTDGEMMGNLGFDQSSGALRRVNEKNREKATFTYWAFDLIDRNEWEQRRTADLRIRKGDLERILGSLDLTTVKIVPTEVVTDPTHAQLMGLCDDYVARGFEGAMVKDVLSPYVFKRGRNLLKVKRFKDADLRVVDFYEGKGKHKGRLGGIVVDGVIDGRECRSRVGSGFDDALREEIWKKRKSWVGAIVQVQYQDFTKDGSLRFPVFVMRREDKE